MFIFYVLEISIGNRSFAVAERVPDTPSEKNYLISTRKIKSGNGQELNMKPNDSPQPTSKTLVDGITTTNSIPENSENVNINSQFSLDFKLTPKDPFTAEVVRGGMRRPRRSLETSNSSSALHRRTQALPAAFLQRSAIFFKRSAPLETRKPARSTNA